MRAWPLGAGLQEQASNHLMLLRLRDVVVSDEEKALLKVSGKFREDERKRTADEASKWIEMLSKREPVGRALINPDGTCLRSGWQPVYRRHDLCLGFNIERENLDLVVRYRGGVARSSEEVPVMGMERRGRVIQLEERCQPV